MQAFVVRMTGNGFRSSSTVSLRSLRHLKDDDRVVFAGCMMPAHEKPKWRCPTCEVSYTGRGKVVEELDEVWCDRSSRSSDAPTTGVLPLCRC